MLIKNTSNQNTPKVVGIGPYWIEPGQERMIPDSILYVDETDDFGNKTGKKIILPAVAVQKRMGLIDYREESPAVKAEEKPEAKQEEQSSDGTPAGDDGTGETEGKKQEEEKAKTGGRKGKKAAAAE